MGFTKARKFGGGGEGGIRGGREGSVDDDR